MAQQQSSAHPVLDCLAEEHRHMSALLRLVDQRASKKQPLSRGDYFLMRDVVAYLHDYPDSVHHPTEDFLFERLANVRPDLEGVVTRLRRQHRQMEQDSAELLQQLDRAVSSEPVDSESAIRERIRSFAAGQSSHMQNESSELFPAAIKSLSKSDWKQIERRSALHSDPLFGPNVHAQHRTLFEFLLDMDRALPARIAASSVNAQERLSLAMAAMERGAGDSVAALVEALTQLKNEAWDVSLGSRRPTDLPGALVAPWTFGWYMGRTSWNCGRNLLGISTTSTKAVCEALFARSRK